MKLSAWLFAVSALCAGGSAVAAQDYETRSAHCNDAPFGSDGGGISGCLEYALRMDDMFIGIGIFGVSPELKTSGGFRVDPLEEKARINLWAGRIGASDGFEYAYAGRAGIEGGLADDIALDLQEFVHELFDVGLRDLERRV